MGKEDGVRFLYKRKSRVGTYLDLSVLSLDLFELILEPELHGALTLLQVLQLTDLFQNLFQLVYLQLDLVTQLVEPVHG